MHCPNCNSTKIIKYGIKQTKIGNKQIYECKACKKHFNEFFIKNKHYPTKIIFKSISLYNLGNTIPQTQKLIAKQHNKTIPISTIHNWINHNKLCNFTKLRKKLKLNPNNIIKQKLFQHHQPYLMRIHTLKLKLTKNQQLQSYIKHITNYNINISKLTQCSEASKQYKKQQKTIKTQHEATEFARITLDISEKNEDRHSILQDLMLANDKATIATELPIYNKKYIGHIDILQYKHPYYIILEYKPIINKQCFNQARLYKYLLKNNLKTNYNFIRAFVFNENECYEIN
jgi:transposase-like protein